MTRRVLTAIPFFFIFHFTRPITPGNGRPLKMRTPVRVTRQTILPLLLTRPSVFTQTADGPQRWGLLWRVGSWAFISFFFTWPLTGLVKLRGRQPLCPSTYYVLNIMNNWIVYKDVCYLKLLIFIFLLLLFRKFYRKIPNISPGRIELHKQILGADILGGLYSGGTYIRRENWVSISVPRRKNLLLYQQNVDDTPKLSFLKRKHH